MIDKKNSSSEISILVNSCDKYADVWPVFFELFWKFWLDCQYPVYLGTNNGDYADPQMRMIWVGPDLNWGDTALVMLATINMPNALRFLDDFLIHASISIPKVAGLFEEMKALNAEHLRLRPVPSLDEPVAGRPHLGYYRSGSAYRLALEIAFWKRDVLMSLIQPW